MSIDEKVVVHSVVHSRAEAIPTQPTLALLDEFLAPAAGGRQVPPAGGTDSEDESEVERTVRSAIYGLPWA